MSRSLKDYHDDIIKKFEGERVGTTVTTREGYNLTCIAYKHSTEVLVAFDDGYEVECKWDSFIKGKIKNPYHKSVCGVGFVGAVNRGVACISDVNIYNTYNTWRRMFVRCYNDNSLERQDTYKGCTVSEVWHNYQNFERWYIDNYYTVGEERMSLDKDIIYKGNKVYSPSTCVFVPSTINSTFVTANKSRGKYPIGVSKHRKRFAVAICRGLEKVRVGSYETPEEAFEVYKLAKEKYIKELADTYKDKIPSRLYEAMYNYKIEITD